MEISNKFKKTALRTAFSYLERDPEENLPKLMAWVDRFAGTGPDSFEPQRDVVRAIVNDPTNNMYKLIMRIMKETDPAVLKVLFENFFLNANIIGWPKQEEYRKKYGCNIPWAILLDPTSACNLHCTGCWAAEYGNRLNLSFDEIDSIITQGKELGVYLYIYTGGEPLVRKKDLIALCEKHSDCEFLSFTNATLIDEDFANEMLRVGNFIPAISIEGFEEATDGRRGSGTYQHVVRAMQLLKEKHLPFGLSCCYTSQNLDSISDDKFIDQMIEWAPISSGTSTTCRSATTPYPHCCRTPSNAAKCMTAYAQFAAKRRSSPWISRTTASLSAAVSPAADATCTSTQTATPTRAYSSTIPIPTFAKKHCSKSCSRRSSWRTTMASRSTRTTCARAPCWKTRSSYAR